MTDPPQPQLIVIGGPNGAGKSTLARSLLVDPYEVRTFVNADQIARGLSGFEAESVGIDAARLMLAWLNRLASQRQDFAFETTLAGRGYGRWIKGLQQSGYRFHLHFVTLSSPELAVQRVASRVRMGGHHVPEADVRRRYQRALRNFFELYMPLADEWTCYDNSTAVGPDMIAYGARQETPTLLQLQKWHELWERGHDTQ